MSSAPCVGPSASSVQQQLVENMAASMDTYNSIMVPRCYGTSNSSSSSYYHPFSYIFQALTRKFRLENSRKSPIPLSLETSLVAVNNNNEELNYRIRCANESDIIPVCHWRSEEFGYRAHWDYMMTIYRCDPNGWFVATDETGEIIGNIFGMNLNEEIAFGGLFAVKKPFRCQGVGGKLWNKRLSHIGNRNLGVNAVESRIVPNTKLGMILSFRMARYLGSIPTTFPNQILQNPTDSISYDLKTFNHINSCNANNDGSSDEWEELKSLIDRLIGYDTMINIVSRESFLKATILDQADQVITVIAVSTNSSVILGYGMIRPRYRGVTIGPLYAENDFVALDICRKLINQMILANKDGPYGIVDVTIVEDDLIDSGCHDKIMKNIIHTLGLERECYLYRMYSKENIDLPLSRVYCLTSSEAFLL